MSYFVFFVPTSTNMKFYKGSLDIYTSRI